MIKSVCVVHDSVAAVFNHPFFSINDASAIRDFTHAVNDRNSSISKSPKDFTLYKLGTFDDVTGEFSLDVPPVVLTNASAVVGLDTF